ncbi:uncharacterized protein LOC141655245 [Silene latifolia]|uniref:uncharacterized protein LOC141655245 n=1 Tax=Silene latifolia TaxID=37657 RepID=UPI003D78427C
MICEPIFKKLKVREHVMWDDQYQATFDKVKEVLSFAPVLSPPVVGLPLSMYLTVTNTAMGVMLAQTVDKEERAFYYIIKKFLDYKVKYKPLEKTCLALVWATKKLRHYMLSYSRSKEEQSPISLPTTHFLADNPIEEIEVVDTLSFPDENVVHVENDAWDLYFDGASNYMGYGVGILLISPTGEHVPVSIKLDFNVTNNAVEYEAFLFGLRNALDLGVKKLLVHGDSSLVINKIVCPYVSERRSSPAYVSAIDDAEEGETEPWYTAILKYKETGEYPPDLDMRGKRALPTAKKVMEEVHDRECGLHMNAHILVRKIMRIGYYWTTMETDCCKYIRHCHNCQGINIIGKVNQSGTGGHCFVLVEIDYFTKWVEAKSYKVLKAEQVAQFIQNDIICQYGDHMSSSTNGAVEAANKTITVILRKMSDNYREWPEKIPFALLGYRTSIRTATGATPYYLVYGMEAVQPVELEVPSLRILLESQVPEADWVQARYDSLLMLDEQRLNALYHVQLYQKRI